MAFRATVYDVPFVNPVMTTGLVVIGVAAGGGVVGPAAGARGDELAAGQSAAGDGGGAGGLGLEGGDTHVRVLHHRQLGRRGRDPVGAVVVAVGDADVAPDLAVDDHRGVVAVVAVGHEDLLAVWGKGLPAPNRHGSAGLTEHLGRPFVVARVARLLDRPRHLAIRDDVADGGASGSGRRFGEHFGHLGREVSG